MYMRILVYIRPLVVARDFLRPWLLILWELFWLLIRVPICGWWRGRPRPYPIGFYLFCVFCCLTLTVLFGNRALFLWLLFFLLGGLRHWVSCLLGWWCEFRLHWCCDELSWDWLFSSSFLGGPGLTVIVIDQGSWPSSRPRSLSEVSWLFPSRNVCQNLNQFFGWNAVRGPLRLHFLVGCFRRRFGLILIPLPRPL